MIVTAVMRNPTLQPFSYPILSITSSWRVLWFPKFDMLAIIVTYIPENLDSVMLLMIMESRKNWMDDRIVSQIRQMLADTSELIFRTKITKTETNLIAVMLWVLFSKELLSEKYLLAKWVATNAGIRLKFERVVSSYFEKPWFFIS